MKTLQIFQQLIRTISQELKTFMKKHMASVHEDKKAFNCEETCHIGFMKAEKPFKCNRQLKFSTFTHRQSRIFFKDSLDSIPSPSPSVKIQIMGSKVCLRCKGKTLLVDITQQCFALLPQVNFPANDLNFY